MRYQSINNHYQSPSKIDIHEHKAPTEESIRYIEEVERKILDNIVAKIKIEDNIFKGEAFAYLYPTSYKHQFLFVFKFEINGTIIECKKEHEFDYFDFEDKNQINNLSIRLKDEAKAAMLWWMSKYFTAYLFSQYGLFKFDESIQKIYSEWNRTIK